MKHKSIEKDLYVTSIALEADEDDLRKLFALCGTVRAVHLMTDQKSGQFKGTAFVRMSTAAEAKDARVTLDGTRLYDRCITISPARPKINSNPAVTTAGEKPRRERRPQGRRK